MFEAIRICRLIHNTNSKRFEVFPSPITSRNSCLITRRTGQQIEGANIQTHSMIFRRLLSSCLYFATISSTRPLTQVHTLTVEFPTSQIAYDHVISVQSISVWCMNNEWASDCIVRLRIRSYTVLLHPAKRWGCTVKTRATRQPANKQA